MLGTGVRAYFLLLPAAALLAQTPPTPSARLAQARNILAERAVRLPDYTCLQTVDRRYFRRHQQDYPVPSCAQILALSRDTLAPESTDRVRLEVKVSDGQEIGSWAGSRFSSRSIFDLTGGGPYGTGMLGPLILDVFINGGASYEFMGDDAASPTPLAAFGYRVPVYSSHYHIASAAGWETTAFHGAFWLDAGSSELKRLIVVAPDLPPASGVCEANTRVDYQQVRVGGGKFLLPQRSVMRMVMRDASETQSIAVYSACREFRGEATIHFDDAPTGVETKAAAASGTALPAGLQLSMALTEPLDTETAAAGDIVRGALRSPVRDPRGKAILLPAGTVIEGRIVQMQHWLESPRKFTIGILLEKLLAGGESRPIYAKVRHAGAIAVSSPGQSPLVGAFEFATNKSAYRVPAGYRSTWVTVAPPREENK
ncbi:MAG: hypothetical protein ABSH50_20740 [Bryobacteraceae bacterium]|jgi:hypothetical protein